ncbi:MAG: NAD(P)/FAD-dependent oxidoreductase [Pirellulaceae bacterium]|nr:NAD(P)/FAD-dependent oxidoreductase [Pirellulaceae bacterium]
MHHENCLAETSGRKPIVVIIGGGFGGLQAARSLRRATARVILVDRHNYHLFQPLLYQVATGGLSPANIASPLRYILRKQKNCEVFLGEVVDVDFKNQRIHLIDGQLEYDELIVAAGATHSYFGRDEWSRLAPGLKTISDAIEIRRRVFIAFEAAEREPNPDIRQAQLTFVIVGAGPTGVELAGTLSEIARHTLRSDFRHIQPEEARILLIENAGQVLSSFPPELQRKAEDSIRKLGIQILTNTKVTEITKDSVRLAAEGGETIIAARTVLWAAGVAGNSLGRIIAGHCNIETDRAGRVPVKSGLTLASYSNVYIIGDLALCLDDCGKPLPGLAPVAMQQGSYVAKALIEKWHGRSANVGFQYRSPGIMATIGRSAAVAQLGNRQFSGQVAWLLWLVAHLLQIVQFENRLLVFLQWAWNYFTLSRSSRIITGDDPVELVAPMDGTRLTDSNSH